MIPLLFRDDKFEQPGIWEQTLGETHFHQRFLHEEDLIYCETLMTVHGATDIDAAVSRIRAPWDWWEHGRITDFVIHEDGTHDQNLAPVWWFMTRVGVRTFPPVALPGLKGQRVSILLSGDFSGVSSMDAYPPSPMHLPRACTGRPNPAPCPRRFRREPAGWGCSVCWNRRGPPASRKGRSKASRFPAEVRL